jgi:DNA-binding PadR family transcriptional regulator
VSKRRVGNPLALAVLACLAERPMHPYEMATTMRERHKDESIKLNYGSLYSVVEALCRNGFIESKETVREGNRPERTVFELTEAGHLELSDWLSELLARPIKEFPQYEAGLSLIPALSPGEALVLLKARCDQIEIELAKARSIEDMVRGRKIPRLFTIETEYRSAMRAAELAWTRQLIAEITAGNLEGCAEWQAWYAGGNPAKAPLVLAARRR